MNKDYSKRLEQLRSRRFDENIQKAILSESFGETTYSDSLKYVLESMKPIDSEYTKNTYKASEKIQDHLQSGLKKSSIHVEFRHQGSVETNTNIKLHSDIDLLVILGTYFTLEHPQTPQNPYKGKPLEDLKELRTKGYNILDSTYKQVDSSNDKSIKVFPTSPKRKIDVVSSNWYNSNKYVEKGRDEVWRGVQIYDNSNHSRFLDFPFLHIQRINSKDRIVNGGLKMLIRFLKTLKEDADYEIDLSSFDITSIVYAMGQENLDYGNGNQLKLLNEVSFFLDMLINNNTLRASISAPNDTEKVFKGNEKVVDLKKLKLEVDEIIEDINNDLEKNIKKMEHQIYY